MGSCIIDVICASFQSAFGLPNLEKKHVVYGLSLFYTKIDQKAFVEHKFNTQTTKF